MLSRPSGFDFILLVCPLSCIQEKVRSGTKFLKQFLKGMETAFESSLFLGNLSFRDPCQQIQRRIYHFLKRCACCLQAGGHLSSVGASNPDPIVTDEEAVNPNELRLTEDVSPEPPLVCGCETKRNEIKGDAEAQHLTE